MSSEQQRRFWDAQADTFDRRIAAVERRFLTDSRPWVCGRASGDVLEVAIGTGLNLPHYAPDVRLTGVEISPGMAAGARRRVRDLGLDAEVLIGDAQELPFADASFDAVVCTFALCSIPDDRRGLAEMLRALRPGGALLLADHVAPSNPLLRLGARLLDLITVPLQGEHWSRRPLPIVADLGARIVASERVHGGVIERVHAVRPR